MDIAVWLRDLGLERYAQTFRDNEINESVLPKLTAEDLKDLGVVAVGHRRILLDAIANLRAEPVLAEQGGSSSLDRVTRSRASPSEAERRQLTVMFCDLVGSTELSAKLDPEDLRATIGAYHRCATELVERNGGFVAKYMGDGVLAYFGYPRAHEHDAERAIRAGLALAEAVPKLATNAELPLQVRIGIATGLVVVGDLIGAGAAQELAVVGETPNLAARLQALAEPGAVVIASSTRRLTGGLFEYRDLGSVSLKGFAENVSAWQVLGAGASESRFEALRSATTPLVGRDEEIDLLMRRWERAKDGDGCVVLISGEPGIGKSRIAQTILERLGGEPHTRLRYFCSPHHQDSALYPVISQLEHAAGFRRDDSNEQRLTKLEAVLAQATNDLSEAVPLLAELLSISTGERYPPLNLTPQKRKEKTFQALLAQVEGLAVRGPVLMVFEDLHWADPTTREALDLIVDRIPALRVLLILTFRPEFAAPWIGRPQVTLLTLNRLPPRQRAQMISGVIGGKSLPKEIADQIIERTDGIPLFVEELTKAVVESGVVAEAGDHFEVAGPVTALAIPTSLHASLLARLDRLAPVREVAQIAAALGRSFSHELVSAVAVIPGQNLDDALGQLVASELIFRRGTPPDAEYTFKHALVQDAAYSTLLKSRRQQIHRRIAEALEQKFPDIVAAQPALLAQHCIQAGLIEKAVGYWLKAGQQSVARSAMTEAAVQLEKGVGLLGSLPDKPTREQWEVELRIALGQALMATKGYAAPESGEVFSRARELCEHLDRPQELAQALVGQLMFRIVRGELEKAEHHAKEIYHLGEARNDVMWKCFGSFFSGSVCFWLGKFMDASVYLETALSCWDPNYRAVATSPDDPHVMGLVFLSRTLVCLGYLDQARLRRDEGLAEARRLSSYPQAFALVHTSKVDWAIEGVKSPQATLRSAEEAAEISGEPGFPLWLSWGTIVRGWSLGAMGHAVEGISSILQGMALRLGKGAYLGRPFCLALLADVYGMSAQPEEGLKRIAEALEFIEKTQERWVEADIHRLRGTLLLSTCDEIAAESSFLRAITVARQQSAKFWELRTALDLARLWRDQGKRTAARDLLAPVYNWFTEGFDTPVLKEAKALLDELQ